MPNIRQQRVSKDEIYIQASDGLEIAIARTQIQAFYQNNTSGSAASRKAATIAEFKQRIQDAFGIEQITINLLALDFNQADLNEALTLQAND